MKLPRQSQKTCQDQSLTADMHGVFIRYAYFWIILNKINQKMQGLSLYGQPIIKMTIVGQGNFSEVYLAQSKSGKKAAIKKVKKSSKDKTAYELAKKQAMLLNGLHSPNVLELIGTHEQHNYFYIIQKFYEGECLQSILKKKKSFHVSIAQRIFKNLVKCMEYLRSHKIMHRDIKPDNIIVNQKNQVFLIDFGFATPVDGGDPVSLNDRFGTPFYMSPEMMGRKFYNSKSDIWSLGVIYYQMIFGSLPFYGNNDAELYKDVTEHKGDLFKKNDHVPTKIKTVIKRCLTVDIKKRLSWEELFSECKVLHTTKEGGSVTGGGKSSRYSRRNEEIYAEDTAVCCGCCFC